MVDKFETARLSNSFITANGKRMANGQYKLTNSIYVFKKVHAMVNGKSNVAIANLVIPKGAIVNLADVFASQPKMRANVAFCHSIVTKVREQQSDKGYSDWDTSFKYYSGSALGLSLEDFLTLDINSHKDMKLSEEKRRHLAECRVVPKGGYGFDSSSNVCASGIHFFLSLNHALKY